MGYAKNSLAALALLLAPVASAAPVTWLFDVATTGQDVAWVSPTAADPTAAEFDATYTIDLVEVDVRWTLFTFRDIDVTDEIPAELRSNSQTIAGPAPTVLFDGEVVFPEPPDVPGLAARLRIELNATGHGSVSLSEVELGPFSLDLGPPLGVQTVTLTRVRIAGEVEITPVFPGDADRDGDVDLTDLARVLSAFGACAPEAGYDAGADFDDSGCVDLTDLATLLANFGRS